MNRLLKKRVDTRSIEAYASSCYCYGLTCPDLCFNVPDWTSGGMTDVTWTSLEESTWGIA